jgi:hypothetical protein
MAFRSTLRWLLFVTLVLGTAFAGLGLASSGPPLRLSLRGGTEAKPQLGMLQRSLVLVCLDPSTLAPLPRPRLGLGDHHSAASFSPDRSRLVLSNNAGRLLFVDVRRFKRVATFQTPSVEGFRDTAWFRGRLLAVSNPGAHRVVMFVIDPNRRVLLGQRSFEGALLDRARTSRELVLLVGPEEGEGIGPASLVVVDRDGALRRITLDRIVGGSIDDELAEDPGNSIYRFALPGLAVDPVGRKAYVVAAGAPVAEVDLETLVVSYHELSQPVSALERLRDWLEPAAEAKSADGPQRRATWLGNGALAVFGSDYHGWIDGNGRVQMRTSAAGVKIVDVRSWTVRTLDPVATTATVADNFLLTTGQLHDSTTERSTGIGLRAYGTDGLQRYHVLGTAAIDVQAVGQRAIVSFGGSERHQVLNLTDGSLVRAAKGWAPILLAGSSSFDG